MSNNRHSISVEIPGSPQSTRSGSTSPLPTQTYHSSILPSSIPIPALVDSAAGGAHYAGVKVDGGSAMRHRRSSSQQHHTELNHEHRRVLDDLTELYCCRPTLEIFERSWSNDAEFQVCVCVLFLYTLPSSVSGFTKKCFSRIPLLSVKVIENMRRRYVFSGSWFCRRQPLMNDDPLVVRLGWYMEYIFP